MNRIYHPYWKWECYKNGMWRKETKQYELNNFESIIEFTGNYKLYGSAMFKVINLWVYSCENFLSNESINKLAYIGHIACCYEKKYPEYLVRKAWGLLTNEQRYLANNEAEKAYKTWKHKKELEIISKVGNQGATKMEYQMKLQLK